MPQINLSIDPENWDARVDDIFAVLASATFTLTNNLLLTENLNLRVQRGFGSEFPRCDPAGHAYIIWLDVEKRRWDQFSYQYAHELCHALSGCERLHKKPNKWFHEVLCETASLFVLRGMAVSWRSRAPYPNWTSYAESLQAYAQRRIDNASVDDAPLPEWLQTHITQLEKDEYLRPLNLNVACRILPFFEERAGDWECVRHIPDSDASFEDFLQSWAESCPEPHRDTVRRIQVLFGVGPTDS